MKLYRYELMKLLTNKIIWIALLGAVAINIFLSVWSAKNELVEADDYKRVYAELQRINDNDRIEEYLNNWYAEIAEEDYANRMFYYSVRTQFEKIKSYDSFLEEIESRASTITKVSIFSDKDSFAYRSILRTPPAYRHLKGIRPRLVNSKPVTAATDTLYTDLLAFLLIFLVTMLLLLNEKEKGLFALLRPAKKGRVDLIFTKMLAIYSACIGIYFSLYAGKYCISTIMYGSCDLSAVIQSLEGFTGSTLKLSIAGYLIIYSITKIAAYFLIASILAFLCIIAKTALFVYVTSFSYAIISSLFYVLIKANSYLSILKFINPVCLIDTNVLYKNYLDLNFFGQPLNLLKAGIAMLIFGNLLFIAAILIIFAGQKNLIFHDSRFVSWLFNHMHIKRRASASLWKYEAYKILIVNKGLFIIIAAMLLGWNSYKAYQMPFIMYDSIYKFYISQLEGPIGEHTYDFIEKEAARYQQLKDDLAILDEQLREGKINILVYENLTRSISMELQREIGFMMLQDKVAELEPFYEKESKIKPWLVYDTGYNQLLGVMKNEDMNFAHLIFLISLIACAAPVYAAENTFAARRLLMTTARGRLHSLYRRLGTAAVVTGLLYIAAYLPGLVNILESYGTRGIEAPIQSISRYHEFPLPLSIGGFLCLLYAVRLLAALIMLMLVLCISYYSRNTATALSLASAIFLVPYVIKLLGLDFVSPILWNPNIIVCEYFMDTAASDGRKYILIFNLVVIAAMSFYIIRKTYRNINNAM